MRDEMLRLLGEKDAQKILAGIGTNSTRLVQQLMEASDILGAVAEAGATPVRDPGAWGKDVAAQVTNQNVVGFSRLLVKYDDTTMDQMAAAGLTLLTDNNGALNVRHYKSTDPSNPLTSEPTSTTIADYVSQQFRLDLKQFIGRKMVDGLTTDIAVVCNSRMLSLYNNQIIAIVSHFFNYICNISYSFKCPNTCSTEL